MGLDNPLHIAFLLVVLLLVFGARRLPEIGRSIGGGMRGFRDALSGEDPVPSPVALEAQPRASASSHAVEAQPRAGASSHAVEAQPQAGPAPVERRAA